MKTKTLTQFLLGSSAALAVAAPLALVRADDKPKADAPSNSLTDGFKRFLQGLGASLDADQKKELDKALDDFQQNLKDDGGAKPGQPREYRFEWRSDGAKGNEATPSDKNDDDEARAPRSRARIEPEAPRRRAPQAEGDPLQQLREQLRGQMGLDLDQFFGEDFLGPMMRDLGGQRGGANLRQMLERGARAEKRSAKYEKGARRAMAEFRPVVAEARDSVVTLYADGEQVALATIVSADGYALTKASMLGDAKEVEVEFSDGRTVTAKKVDDLAKWDLALVKLDATGLKPIEWNAADDPAVGSLVAAGSPDEDPLAIGVISVAARNLDGGKKGFLGVGMDGADGGVKVTDVSKGSAAEKAGLQVGDVITAIDGKAITSPRDLTTYITGCKAEDDVHVTYRRGADEKTAVATLQSRDDMFVGTLSNGQKLTESDYFRMRRMGDVTARMGGVGNDVADGFPKAVQNDLLIDPNQCGGPVLDLDGRAVGINIARAERTKTYAIPAGELVKLLANVGEGKLAEAKDLSDLKRDARLANAKLDELRQQLERAEKEAAEAKKALDEKAK